MHGQFNVINSSWPVYYIIFGRLLLYFPLSVAVLREWGSDFHVIYENYQR